MQQDNMIFAHEKCKGNYETAQSARRCVRVSVCVGRKYLYRILFSSSFSGSLAVSYFLFAAFLQINIKYDHVECLQHPDSAIFHRKCEPVNAACNCIVRERFRQRQKYENSTQYATPTEKSEKSAKK